MLTLKQAIGMGLNLSLPLADLYRMDAMLVSDLMDCLDSAERPQPHLGLELQRMNSVLF